MLRKLLFHATLLVGTLLYAQPDSLYIPENGETVAYAVVYEPVQNVERFRREGKYAFDTSRVAVQIDGQSPRPRVRSRTRPPRGR